MQRESKGRNKSTKKYTRWHTDRKEKKTARKTGKMFMGENQTCRWWKLSHTSLEALHLKS